ncbi:hypothetical protein OF83DRAFT_1175174 [Amylostereum chailletii]|nr:hypothetical protein OF83DRAFT_1175174 [Amylostereum chailletii]
MFSVVEIDERVLALRDRINEAECSIREYQEQRNDLSPLFKLPNEIIHQIFDTILDAEFPPLVPFAVWPPGRVPSWIPFTHVCRRLRRLSIEYPHLWSRIGNICGMWSYLLLERSSPGPVDINVDVDHHQPFLALLPESLHRVRKLHLRGNAPNLESAIKLLHKAAPQLIEFDLDRTDCINGGSEEDPILELANTIFSGFPPQYATSD